VASLLVVGLLGTAATQAPWSGDEEGAAADRATTAAQADTTTAPPDGTDSTIGTISATTAPPAPDSTAPPGPEPTSTTVTPTTVPRPPTTGPPADDVHPGGPCSPVGATAITADGVPVVCTAEKCHGAPFSEPRWRRAAC
jgi:serine/threonine-protein kinase